MSLQFEHNSFFRNELKEQNTMIEYINKELDDVTKEIFGLKSLLPYNMLFNLGKSLYRTILENVGYMQKREQLVKNSLVIKPL